MKKFIVLLITLAFVLSMASCGGNSEKSTGSKQKQPTTTEASTQSKQKQPTTTEASTQSKQKQPTTTEASNQSAIEIYNTYTRNLKLAAKTSVQKATIDGTLKMNSDGTEQEMAMSGYVYTQVGSDGSTSKFASEMNTSVGGQDIKVLQYCDGKKYYIMTNGTTFKTDITDSVKKALESSGEVPDLSDSRIVVTNQKTTTNADGKTEVSFDVDVASMNDVMTEQLDGIFNSASLGAASVKYKALSIKVIGNDKDIPEKIAFSAKLETEANGTTSEFDVQMNMNIELADSSFKITVPSGMDIEKATDVDASKLGM